MAFLNWSSDKDTQEPSGVLDAQIQPLDGVKHTLFYPALYRKNMKRFWPIWAAYGVFWFFLLLVPLTTEYSDPISTYSLGEATVHGTVYFARAYTLQITAASAPQLSALVGILAAMAVFSYLFSSRSAGMIHALPVKRLGLFWTNWLSGLSFFALPQIALFLMTLISEAINGAFYFPGAFTWLFVNFMTALFFYSFAVFCAMFTGHILALPVFYGILNFLAIGLHSLIQAVLTWCTYGYAYSPFSSPNGLVEWLTPLFQLSSSLYPDAVIAPDGAYALFMRGLPAVFAYGFAGLVLAAAALGVYTTRHLEHAGDVVSVPQMRPVFRYGVALCAALSGGLMLFYIFRLNHTNTMGWSGTVWAMLPLTLLCGAIGYFAAEMLLQKSFRVFQGIRIWRGFGIFALVLCALAAVIRLDLFGFERWMPDSRMVASVEIDSSNPPPHDSFYLGEIALDGPDQIDLALRLHQALLSERAEMPDSPLDLRSGHTERIKLDYTLADGETAKRSYQIYLSRDQLEDPNSAASLLEQFMNDPEIVRSGYFSELDRAQDVRLTDVQLTCPEPKWDLRPEQGDRTLMSGTIALDFTASQRDQLLEAIYADIAAGNLGRRYLLGEQDEERKTNCYYNDLTLTFSYTTPPDSNPRVGRNTSQAVPTSYTISITLQASASNTLRVLEAAGIPRDQLVPYGEYLDYIESEK